MAHLIQLLFGLVLQLGGVDFPKAKDPVWILRFARRHRPSGRNPESSWDGIPANAGRAMASDLCIRQIAGGPKTRYESTAPDRGIPWNLTRLPLVGPSGSWAEVPGVGCRSAEMRTFATTHLDQMSNGQRLSHCLNPFPGSNS